MHLSVVLLALLSTGMVILQPSGAVQAESTLMTIDSVQAELARERKKLEEACLTVKVLQPQYNKGHL